MMFLIKLGLFFFVLYLLFQWGKRVLRNKLAQMLGVPNEKLEKSGDLVQCAHCQKLVAADLVQHWRSKDYCSEECLKADQP